MISFEMLMGVIAGVIILIIVAIFAHKYAPKRTRKSAFQSKWKDIIKHCAHKETWPSALSMADELLDEALKKRRYKGKNMGERLVSAQKAFTENDILWSAHKLAVKAREHPKMRLKEKDVKTALASFRQGLKDVGVL